MIGNVLAYYTFRHRYAKTSHFYSTPLTSIPAAIGQTTEVSHLNYLGFISSSTTSRYAHSNAKVD